MKKKYIIPAVKTTAIRVRTNILDGSAVVGLSSAPSNEPLESEGKSIWEGNDDNGIW